MNRRPGRTTLALALPLVLFIVYGVARVAAPVSALGLIFNEPLEFALVAVAVALLGAALLLSRRVELSVAHALAGPSRPPSDDERGRLDPLLAQVGEHAGIDPAGLIVRIQDGSGINASAGAGHLLFMTRGAFSLDDDQLEAILAHELGHHRGLHPIFAAVVWWLRIPGAALAAVYQALRHAVTVLVARRGRLGRALAIPMLLLVAIWQISVMWIFYLGDLLAMRAARVSEYEADMAAAGWGYARPLAAAYTDMAGREVPPTGRWARLMADHPPLPERIARLEGFSEG